jgi:hypothetical protein
MDLEPGAKRFYGSYHSAVYPDRDDPDPLVRAWLACEHEAARRLAEHCRQQYRVHFRLYYSVRPWALSPGADDRISGSEGVIWHASWSVGEREYNVAELRKELDDKASELMLHLLFDSSTITATFSALDSPEQIADVIGDMFDTFIVCSRPVAPPDFDEPIEAWTERRVRGSELLPPKAQTESILILSGTVDSRQASLFGAALCGPCSAALLPACNEQCICRMRTPISTIGDVGR